MTSQMKILLLMLWFMSFPDILGFFIWIPPRLFYSCDLRSIRFIDNNHGWLSGHDCLYYTDDGGNNWIRQPVMIIANSEQQDLECNFHGYCRLILWADSEKVLVRHDAGFYLVSSVTNKMKIIKDSHGLYKSLRVVSFYSDNYGWGIDEGGFLYFTKDLGKNWLKKYRFSAKSFADIVFVSTKEGWALSTEGRVYHTKDAGIQWKEMVYGSYPEMRYGFSLSIAYKNNVWIGEMNGSIYRTNNAGMTWQKIVGNYDIFDVLYKINFRDKLTGWALGAKSANPYNPDVICEDAISHTAIPCETEEEYNRKMDISFRKYGDGFLIQKTTDGGKSWDIKIKNIRPALLDIQVLPNGHIWVVGKDGYLLHSANGGSDWKVVNIITGVRLDVK